MIRSLSLAFLLLYLYFVGARSYESLFSQSTTLHIRLAPDASSEGLSKALDDNLMESKSDTFSYSLRPLFTLPTEHLDRLHKADTSLPNLSRWLVLTVHDDSSIDQITWVDRVSATQQCDRVQLIPSTETREMADTHNAGSPRRMPQRRRMMEATTPNYEDRQGYFDAVDARFAQAIGAKGGGVTVVHVGLDWHTSHEDISKVNALNLLKPLGSVLFTPGEVLEHRSHGTAAMGIVVGDHNGFGISGLAPEAEIAAAPVSLYFPANSTVAYSVANAIVHAAAALGPGDVILIELDTPVCELGASGPVEWEQATFDAIQMATANGIVVVEPAGDGSVDLDQAACGDLFNRFSRDSGALVVGGGAPTGGTHLPRSRLAFSSHGSRVDVQNWGAGVVTTGFGDLFHDASDPMNEDRWYTEWSGTSSAAALTAGVVAILQSMAIQHLGRPLDPGHVREILVITGSKQPAVDAPNSHIGPLPNLLRAYSIIVSLTPETEPPTPSPSGEPTMAPSHNPSANPTQRPTPVPSVVPTSSPSSFPTSTPTENPTPNRSLNPSATPSATPSSSPTQRLSVLPSVVPTILPTSHPTMHPSGDPTPNSSFGPTVGPTYAPTERPSSIPTVDPTPNPSQSRSSSPTAIPTHVPTALYSFVPTVHPTATPTQSPSWNPTESPTSIPTQNPTPDHTPIPSWTRTLAPVETASVEPSYWPSIAPTPSSPIVTVPSGYANEATKLMAPDGTGFDRFGSDVAMDGKYLVVGAMSKTESILREGAAYVYEVDDMGEWSLMQKLLEDIPASQARFGRSVDIQGDTIVIGAFWRTVTEEEQGAVYIFKLVGSSWLQVQRLVASDARSRDWFGGCLSLDGNRLAVGAQRFDNGGVRNGGAAYVFERTSKDSPFFETQQLLGDVGLDSNFGQFLTMKGDLLVVGAYYDGEVAYRGGSSYIFRYDREVGYVRDKKIVLPDPHENDTFGISSVIKGDWIVISARGRNNHGEVFVYERSSPYNFVQSLAANDRNIDDRFGLAVLMDDDHNIIVGAGSGDGMDTDSGLVYIFEFDTVRRTWSERNVLFAIDGTFEANYGANLAVSSAGLAIAAPTEDNMYGTGAGSVYIYDKW